ncbi:MAG: ribonuclease G [Pseudomonadota bacterium]
MSEELLINVTPQETRVATVENGVLQEVWIERASKRGLVGNVYKGKVVRVLPGMDAAFIDVGLARAAFLHVADISDKDKYHQNGDGERRQKAIGEILREEQEVLVQVIKDPLGTKGARLTTHLTVPSRYLVYMPFDTAVGVSGKIDGATERERLKDIVQSAMDESDGDGSFIVRTAAEGVEADALHRDVAFLRKIWHSLEKRARSARAGTVIHEDLPLVLRTLRDISGDAIERIRIDSRETYQRALAFCHDFLPDMGKTIEHYPGERPIFDIYAVEDEIQKALGKQVQLKSGGYLIIDQTESMTTIDVNTGAFVGHSTLEETIFKTNLEAAQAIARQLRLRNLGGIIIVDFIDMLQDDHKDQVQRALEKAMERDRARFQISPVSSLGLVEMTRKRTRESLEHVLCEICTVCDGRGTIKTAETVCYEIQREIIRQVRQFDVRSLTVLAGQDVVDMLIDEQSDALAELETFIGVPIRLQGEYMYNQEQFDVVLV